MRQQFFEGAKAITPALKAKAPWAKKFILITHQDEPIGAHPGVYAFDDVEACAKHPFSNGQNTHDA